MKLGLLQYLHYYKFHDIRISTVSIFTDFIILGLYSTCIITDFIILGLYQYLHYYKSHYIWITVLGLLQFLNYYRFHDIRIIMKVLQKVLSLGSDYFSAMFYQTYFYYKPSKYSLFTATHFCNLFYPVAKSR